MKSTTYDRFESEMGMLLIVHSGKGVRSVSLIGSPDCPEVQKSWEHTPAHIMPIHKQLMSYFVGSREPVEFVADTGGTAFQNRVWDALMEIPFGTTTTYGELAAKIGKPGSARAVGLTVGANPLMILVPCHRVIGKDGSLTGFAGGLEAKRWLLDHEARLRKPAEASHDTANA